MNTKPAGSRIFESHDGGKGLGDMLERLLAAQKEDWPELQINYAGLGERQSRTLAGAGAGRIVLQCNPARIRSTMAKVDGQSLRERKCFLCTGNLPPGQKGILYRGDYLALCNPYPIFEKHFTIACIDHRPQSITDSLDRFLLLAGDAGPAYTVFYNGPQCGASAPDHLHFQACPSGRLPIENEDLDKEPPLFKSNDREVRIAERTGRGIILVTAPGIEQAKAATADVISALRHAAPTGTEPLLNIIARQENGAFRVMVFPRRKFRPDCFYLEGEKRIAVSPAAVELGGLIITPLQKDFDLLDFTGAVSILKEVSLDRESIIRLLKRSAI
ncbi:MAG: DUF4922 domain-containing protein [Syntrophaceae bacterium]